MNRFARLLLVALTLGACASAGRVVATSPPVPTIDKTYEVLPGAGILNLPANAATSIVAPDGAYTLAVDDTTLLVWRDATFLVRLPTTTDAEAAASADPDGPFLFETGPFRIVFAVRRAHLDHYDIAVLIRYTP